MCLWEPGDRSVERATCLAQGPPSRREQGRGTHSLASLPSPSSSPVRAPKGVVRVPSTKGRSQEGKHTEAPRSPEMRLAMVLVGTNKVCSTPSSSAAFSCSSEERKGWGEGLHHQGHSPGGASLRAPLEFLPTRSPTV